MRCHVGGGIWRHLGGWGGRRGGGGLWIGPCLVLFWFYVEACHEHSRVRIGVGNIGCLHHQSDGEAGDEARDEARQSDDVCGVCVGFGPGSSGVKSQDMEDR